MLGTPTTGKFKGLIGAIISKDANLVTLDLDCYGTISLPPDQIKSIKPINHNFTIGDTVFNRFLGVCTITNIFHNGMICLATAKGHPASCYYKDLEKYPLEQATDQEGQIAKLEKERIALLAEGEIAPEGVWIEYGKVSKRKFIQAYYRSSKPIFAPKRHTNSGLSCRKYIGKKDSEKDLSARRAITRRNRLQEIDRQIKLLKEDKCSQETTYTITKNSSD